MYIPITPRDTPSPAKSPLWFWETRGKPAVIWVGILFALVAAMYAVKYFHCWYLRCHHRVKIHQLNVQLEELEERKLRCIEGLIEQDGGYGCNAPEMVHLKPSKK